jgi:hypothetical protein
MADTSAKDGIIVEVRPQQAYPSVTKSFGLGATGKAFFWSNHSDITGAEQLLANDFEITASHEYDYLKDPLVKWGPFTVRLFRDVAFVDYLRDNGIDLRGAWITVYPADKLTKTCAELDALTAAQALTYTAGLAYIGGSIDGISESANAIDIRASWDDSFYDEPVNPSEIIGGQSWQPPVNVGQTYHVAHTKKLYDKSFQDIVLENGGRSYNNYPMLRLSSDGQYIATDYFAIQITDYDLTNGQIAAITANLKPFDAEYDGRSYSVLTFECVRATNISSYATISGDIFSGYAGGYMVNIGLSEFCIIICKVKNKNPLFNDNSGEPAGWFSTQGPVQRVTVLSGENVYSINATSSALDASTAYSGNNSETQEFISFDSDGNEAVTFADESVVSSVEPRRNFSTAEKLVYINAPQIAQVEGYKVDTARASGLEVSSNQYVLDGVRFTARALPNWTGTVTRLYNSGNTAYVMSSGQYDVEHISDMFIPVNKPNGSPYFPSIFSISNAKIDSFTVTISGLKSFNTVFDTIATYSESTIADKLTYLQADESGQFEAITQVIEGDPSTANSRLRIIIPTLSGDQIDANDYQEIRINIKLSLTPRNASNMILYVFNERPVTIGASGSNYSIFYDSTGLKDIGDTFTMYAMNNGIPAFGNSIDASLFGGKVGLNLLAGSLSNTLGGFSIHDEISRKELLYHFLRTDEGYLYSHQQYGYVLQYKTTRPTSLSSATAIDLTKVNSCKVRNMERGEFVGGVVTIRYGSNPASDDGCAYSLRIGGSVLEYPTQDYHGNAFPAPSSAGQRAKVGFGLIGDAMGEYAGDQCKDVLVMPWIQTADQALRHADNLAFDMGVRKVGASYQFFAPYYADISYVAGSPDLRYKVGDILDLTGLGELGTPTRAYGIVVQSSASLRNSAANDYDMIVKVFAENDPATELTYLQDVFLSTSPTTYIQDVYLSTSPSSYIEDTELAEV